MLGFATKYAGEFQELVVGGRICGMGGTGIAQGVEPASIILNPANAISLNRSLHLMHSENFSGIVKNEFGGFVGIKDDVAYGVEAQMVSVDGIKLTTLPDTNKQPGDDNRPFPYDTVSTRDVIFYLNAAKRKSILNFGLNLKFYYRDLAVMSGFGGGVDVGMKLNLKNLNLGIGVRDFVLAPIFWESKTKEFISPKISTGIAPYFPLIMLNSVVIFELDIIKDLSLNNFSLNSGLEFAYKDKLFFRAGRNENRYTAGAGIKYRKLIFDYGLITHPDLGISNKFSAGIEF
jgi:hypothetical protein